MRNLFSRKNIELEFGLKKKWESVINEMLSEQTADWPWGWHSWAVKCLKTSSPLEGDISHVVIRQSCRIPRPRKTMGKDAIGRFLLSHRGCTFHLKCSGSFQRTLICKRRDKGFEIEEEWESQRGQRELWKAGHRASWECDRHRLLMQDAGYPEIPQPHSPVIVSVGSAGAVTSVPETNTPAKFHSGLTVSGYCPPLSDKAGTSRQASLILFQSTLFPTKEFTSQAKRCGGKHGEGCLLAVQQPCVQFSYTGQSRLLGNGTAHSRLGTPTTVNSQGDPQRTHLRESQWDSLTRQL